MAFCCFKSNVTTVPSRGVKGSIAKNRNELDLLKGQRDMGSTDIGLNNMGIGMGLSFEEVQELK